MDNKQKMAMAGSGLVAASIGLGIVGCAMMVPAIFDWATRLVQRGADTLGPHMEGASKTVGTVAGTLHRSFNAAKDAGIAEIKRGQTKERNAS
jgi:hypothetical protein